MVVGAVGVSVRQSRRDEQLLLIQTGRRSLPREYFLPREVLMTTTSLLPDIGIELREGYAGVGDVILHYVEAGDGPRSSCCTASRSSGSVGGYRSRRSWRRVFGWSPPTRVATTCHRARGLRPTPRPARRRHPRPIGELGAESALLVGHDWGGTIAWITAMNHPEVVDRLAILNAAHPRRLSAGTAQPEPAPEVLVLLLLCTPGTA